MHHDICKLSDAEFLSIAISLPVCLLNLSDGALSSIYGQNFEQFPHA